MPVIHRLIHRTAGRSGVTLAGSGITMGEGGALEKNAAAAAAAQASRNGVRNAAAGSFCPGLGFDAAVGTVLDAQLPFMLLRGTVVETDGQVRHKVEPGAHFLVACDKARAGVAGADAALEEPGLCPWSGHQAQRRADAQDRAVHAACSAVRGPLAGVEVPMAPARCRPP